MRGDLASNSRMIYTEYGKTGAKISAVGFGGMRFDRSKSNEENAELLLYARSKGINYFDTAPQYCGDTSEDIFGIALKQMAGDRDSYYVSTKGRPTSLDTAEKARAAVEKSIRRLNVDKIDFYHVWCIRSVGQYELAMKKGGQYEGLLKCRDEGLIDNIVISTHLPGPQIESIVHAGEFEGVLLGINVLNFPYRWQGIRAAHEMGIGIAAMNPLSGGLIPQHEEELAFIAHDNETPTVAALRFCISCPQITVTLVGFTTKEQIDVACRVAETTKPYTDEDIDRIAAHISENMNALCTGCGYCMQSCPENIPIANYMQVYNEKPLFKRTEKEMRENISGNYRWGLLVDRAADAGDCVECAACEQACTQHLNIIERLREIDGWEKKINSLPAKFLNFSKRVKSKIKRLCRLE